MLVTHGLRPYVPPGNQRRPLALTAGNFDGVHRGHRAMVERVRKVAHERELDSGVLTFEPHPRELFTPDAAPTRLTSLREKLELLAALHVDRVHVQRFSRSFAAMPPGDFIERVLTRALDTRWLLIGEDFRFGAKRAGDAALLRKVLPGYGIELETLDTVTNAGLRISSSAVREALAQGDLARARALLGRNYSISGRIEHGRKLGRTLGFPTANVQLKRNRPPLLGIFAVRVHGVGECALDGVASLGFRPTVSDDRRASLEVHAFDFSGDLYGQHVCVEFVHKLRDEEKYSDLEGLRAAIERDCAAARAFLAKSNA